MAVMSHTVTAELVANVLKIEVDGVVAEVVATAGDVVTEGDPLVVIDEA
jgi:multidrug resistance efflux pump